MSYNDKKSTPADIAATLVILVLAAAIVVLLCIYILKLGGAFEAKPEPVQTTHIISEAAVTETTTETEIIITTTSAVTEESIPAVTVPLGEYDEAFFERTFIVGDSLSTGFVNYEFLPADKVFAQAGLTPSSIMFTEVGGSLVYDKVTENNPEYICIMLGTNGIAYLEADFMSEKMSLFIDELRMNCPDSEIVLVSIPPVTAEHEIDVPETNIDRIKLYNSCIEKLAEEKDVIWVETYSILCDNTGYLADEYAETDGLHLKIHAYPIILSRIQEAIMNYELIQELEAENTSETDAVTESETMESTEEAVVTTLPEETEASEIPVNS
ncbi:MAG: hypothetical protein IJC04_01260 [Oscillospiraceae bacterium]|nr:hypothetical protein [Oscillospiraceae bacterium]